MLKLRIDVFNANKVDKFMVKNIDRLLFCFDENFDVIFESKQSTVSKDIKRIYLDINLDKYAINTNIRQHRSAFKFNIRVDGTKIEIDDFSKWLRSSFLVHSESDIKEIIGTPYLRKFFTIGVKKPKEQSKKSNKQSQKRNFCNPYDNFREIPSSVGIKFYGTKP